MDTSEKASVMAGLIMVAVWILALAGYVMNIFELLAGAFGQHTISYMVMFVRGLGVVIPPLGAIAGYF